MARKLTVVVVVFCLGALVSFAAEGKGKMDAASHAANLKAELNLNAEQTAQVESFFADFLKKMEAVRANKHATQEQLKALRTANPADAVAIKAKESELETIRAKKQTLVGERDAAMKKILTPEQFAKFQELAGAHAKQHTQAGHPK